MAIEDSDTNWPLPRFFFEVSLASQVGGAIFQEVSGLAIEPEEIEYRHGDYSMFSTRAFGNSKKGKVILQTGIFKKDDSFWKWCSTISSQSIKTETVNIQLKDERGATAFAWTLTNAFPSKLTAIDLKTDANMVAVEAIELSYESLVLINK